MTNYRRNIAGLWVFSLSYQTSLKGSCIFKLKVLRKISNRNCLQDSNHSTQQCLFSMLEKWKNTLGKVGFVCAIFIYLSKTTNIMNHDLLIAKLGACGVRKDAFSFLKCCLVKRKQRFHVNSKFSTCEKMMA